MSADKAARAGGAAALSRGTGLPVSVDALVPLCAGLVIIYGLLIPLHLVQLDGRQRALMVLVDALLAAFFLVEHRILRVAALSPRRLRVIAAADVGLPYLSLLLLFFLDPDPIWTGFVAVILIGSGAFFLDRQWFAVSAATISISWTVVLLTALPETPKPPFAAVLLASLALAMAVFVSRRRNLLSGLAALDRANEEIRRREATERELRKSEERLELAIRGSRGGSWNVRMHHSRPEMADSVHLSPALKRMIGFEPDEFPDSLEAWRARILDEDRTKVERSAQLALTGQLPEHRVEYRIRHRSGDILWMEALGRVERDEAGQVIQFSGVDRNITERVERERAVGVLSRAVEQSSSIVLITDPDGDITYVNPKFTEVSGYEKEEVLGRNPRILAYGDTRPEVYADLWQTLSSGEPWHGEFKNRTKSGEPYWALVSISPVTDEAGRITNYLGVQEDITARKQAEESLLRSQRLEAVGHLVSGVAHDFNNLLTSILGFSEMAISEMEEDAAACRPYLENVISAGETAASLTRQLLAIGRQQALRPRIVDLNTEIGRTEELLRRTLGEDIEIVMNLDPEIGQTRVDPAQLQQVLLNLAVNARDAMPTGGVLTFETSKADIDEQYLTTHPGAAPGPFLVLAISDTGCGMKSDVLQRIFEPFFTTKTSPRGTGLGLATTYGIIKQSGGYIWAYSEPGEGTSFKIYLPRHDDVVEAPVQRPALSHGRGTETILLVEDEERVRRLLADYLTSHGYTILEASCADEALSIAAAPDARFELLITDLVLPTDNGLRIAEQLGRERPDLKVLLITGYAETAVQRKYVLDPEIPLLTKPFTMRLLLQTVRGILDGTAPQRKAPTE